jgi:23S rRNA (adenine2503-C2)-methyltransferase
MTDIGRADRTTLRENLAIVTAKSLAHQSASDGTQKLLLGWPEGDSNLSNTTSEQPRRAECVMIPAESSGGVERYTACISSQFGCAVGCRFCASGMGGLLGNLRTDQIVEQVWHLNRLPHVRRITNVVFMGMGEPLANFNAVVAAIRILTAGWAFDIAGRRVTVSTVGLPAQMRRLADLSLPITLAISLHAADDELRRKLIPWAEHTSIDALVEAGRYYFDRTGREVTIEYILLGGVNDRPKHARQLARVARQLRCQVNLIRYNEVASLSFERPASEDVHAFQSILHKAGVNCQIRASRGRDITAACGQLHHERSTTA